LRDNLLAADAKTVNSVDLKNLLKDEENIIFHFGDIGAIQTRLDTASSISNRRKASLNGLVSREADADLALTLVSLSEVQNAYTAALQTGGRILGLSLLDFLR
ncbi:MAG: flagellin, partial [Opitutales bacterium]